MNANTNNNQNASAAAEQQPFPALAEYQAKKGLVTALEAIFERIEILSADARINEGEYLQFAELVKDMYAFRQSVRTNTVYVEIARQSRAREPVAPKSDREKLTDKNSCVCNRCDKPVHKHYLASGEHHRTATCIRAFQNKLNVKAHKAVHNGRYAHLQVLNLDLVAKVDAGRYGEGSFLRKVLEFSPLERRNTRSAPTPLTSAELNYHKIDGRWVVMPDDYEPPVSSRVVPQAHPDETEEEKTERLRLRRNQLSRESKARARARANQSASGGGASADVEVEECMTCLQDYTMDRRIKLSAPCGHHMCVPCWKGLKRHNEQECSCPMCRADLTAWISNSV